MRRKQFFQKPAATLWCILVVCLSGILIINACRKADKVEEPPVVTDTNNMKERFFKEHKATDPLVQAVSGYFQHLPDTQFAISKIVSKIGYPRWDKALVVSGPKTGTAGRGNSGDSITISYIPFVRDSQNYVNASLLVKTTEEDTVFKYLCDWEYSEYGYDSSATGWNARNVFHLFSKLDNNVFNIHKYRIWDEDLLTQAEKDYITSMGRPFDSLKVVYTFKPAGNTGWRNNSINSFVTECNTVEVCIAEPPPTSQNRGTSMAQPCTIMTSYICTETWVDDFPGGGSGGEGGSGSTGGGGGSGGGGTGGDGTPPECFPTSARSLIVNPCQPGWGPIPDEPAIFLPPYVINNLTNPCLNAALLKLSSGTSNTFFKQIYNTFDTSTVNNLEINEGDLTSISAYGLAEPPLQLSTGVAFSIKLDTVKLLNCSQEWMAYVMIHEVVHAAMLANVIPWDTTNSQHASMMSLFLDQMSTSLTAALS